jgi:uncharacterized protein
VVAEPVRLQKQLPATPTIYDCTVVHRRRTTVDREFRYRSTYWLVDADALPSVPAALRPFVQFRAGDHLGDPDASIGDNVRARLAQDGLTADRVLMLTCPRSGGHVFNPLTVFWCLRAGEVVAVLAEVHNTYSGRHVYLLQPDGRGRSGVEKRFYVSPFLPMGGRYTMRTPLPGDRLQVAVTLHVGDSTPFVATLTGHGKPATATRTAAAVLRRPLLTLRTAALIRWQGIRLWARGIPVQPRPADATQNETAVR